MRLRLSDLQSNDDQAKKLRATELSEGWVDIKGVFQYESFSYNLEIIRSELISRYHNNLLAGHFGIDKIRELIARKYYWPTLRRDVEAYIKGCDVCMASKAI